MAQAAGRPARAGRQNQALEIWAQGGRQDLRRLDAAHEGRPDGAGLSRRRRAGQRGLSSHGRAGRRAGQFLGAGAGRRPPGRAGRREPAGKRGAVRLVPAPARPAGAAGRAGAAGGGGRLLGRRLDPGPHGRRAARRAQAQSPAAAGRAAPGPGAARHAGTRARVGGRHVCRAVPLRARHHRQPCPHGRRTRVAAVAPDRRGAADGLGASRHDAGGGAAAGIPGRCPGAAPGRGKPRGRGPGRARHAGPQSLWDLRAAPPGRARTGALRGCGHRERARPVPAQGAGTALGHDARPGCAA